MSKETQNRGKRLGFVFLFFFSRFQGETPLLHHCTFSSTFDFCREKNFALCNLLEGRELSEELQSNIQLFGKTLLECLKYFENEKILSDEERKPYTTESAKKKIALLKEILEV